MPLVLWGVRGQLVRKKAIVKVHLDKGFFMSSNGYEYALASMAVTASLVVSGQSVPRWTGRSLLKPSNSCPGAGHATHDPSMRPRLDLSLSVDVPLTPKQLFDPLHSGRTKRVY